MRRFLLIAILFLSPHVFSRTMVILDPGHGGMDAGCVWPPPPAPPLYKEATFTLQIAQAVYQLLEFETDIDGTMTHLGQGATINKRVSFTENIINQGSATYNTFIFLSIHLNSSSEKAKGVEVFYYPNSSLAPETHEFAFYTQYRQIEKRGMEMDRTIRDGTRYMTERMTLLRELSKSSPKPHHSALIEVAFLNPNDFLKSLQDNPNFINDVVAPSILSGIKDIIKDKKNLFQLLRLNHFLL